MVNPIPFFESAQLPNAAPATPGQYVSPAQVSSVVKKLTLTNTDTTTGYLVTIYIVPSGSAVGAAYLFLFQRSIGPKQTVDVTEAVNQILNGGDFISAFADTAAKVNMRISGVQIT